jgi:hypothetical protein
MVPSSLRARSHPSSGSELLRPRIAKLGYGEGSLDHVKLIISAREPVLIRPASAQQATHARTPRIFHVPRIDATLTPTGRGFIAGGKPPVPPASPSGTFPRCSLTRFRGPGVLSPPRRPASVQLRVVRRPPRGGSRRSDISAAGTSRHRLTAPPRLDPRRVSLRASRHVCRRLTTPSRRFHRTICRGYLSETRGTAPPPALGILSVVQIGGRTRRGPPPIFPR